MTSAGFTARMEPDRVPKYLPYVDLFMGKVTAMGLWKDIVRCLGDDMKAFGADEEG